jgi:hypothetical protein
MTAKNLSLFVAAALLVSSVPAMADHSKPGEPSKYRYKDPAKTKNFAKLSCLDIYRLLLAEAQKADDEALKLIEQAQKKEDEANGKRMSRFFKGGPNLRAKASRLNKKAAKLRKKAAELVSRDAHGDSKCRAKGDVDSLLEEIDAD